MSEVAEKPEVENIHLDELVKTYLTIRAQKDKLYNDYKEKESELKNELVQIEQVLLSKCEEMSADSIRTGSGTIIKTLKEEFVCSDWGSFTEQMRVFHLESAQCVSSALLYANQVVNKKE